MFTITKASENIKKKFNNAAYDTDCAKMYECDIIFAFFVAGGGSGEGGH
jgi:hypothetical protein